MSPDPDRMAVPPAKGGAPRAPEKPSGLAIVVFALGLASWVFGCCVSLPVVGLAIGELVLIRKGRSPAAGKTYAWVGLGASAAHVLSSFFVLLAFGTGLAALLLSVDLPFGEVCVDREVCATEGQCGTSHELAGDWIYRCYVRDENDCRASRACIEDGRCEYDPRVSLRCIRPERLPPVPPPVTSVCELSSDCARWGRCDLVEGACLATRPKDCEHSLGCVVEGQCTLSGHACVAGSPADCAGSLECELYGRCTHESLVPGAGGTCVAPGEPWSASCNYSGADADRCARTGECLRNPQGQCESLADHGRRSPLLEDVRRRIREATPVERPTRLR